MTDHQQQPNSEELARVGAHFAGLSQRVAAEDGTVDPQALVSVSGAILPHARHCGLTLVRPNRAPETVAASDELPNRVDALQYELDQGPCLDASERDSLVISEDLSTDARWPEFAPRCVAETGVRSMMSVQVRLIGADRAALNFYARQRDVFDELDVGVASIMAPFAAMAVSHVLHQREVANLGAALGSSRQIGTAIGILMARFTVTSTDAFAMLVQASQHMNRKLRDVAADVELTGQLPTKGDRAAKPDQRGSEPSPGTSGPQP